MDRVPDAEEQPRAQRSGEHNNPGERRRTAHETWIARSLQRFRRGRRRSARTGPGLFLRGYKNLSIHAFKSLTCILQSTGMNQDQTIRADGNAMANGLPKRLLVFLNF